MRWLGVVALVLTALGGIAVLFGDTLGFMAFRWFTTPEQPFAAEQAPPAPDYTLDANWAALPQREDGADVVPAGLTDAQAQASAAVFFVHPTTYLNSAGWNAPLDDADSATFVDRYVLAAQANVFNACCAVFAPRYRQATIAAFFDDTGRPALELAYADVDRAFDEFLARIGPDEPFVLAGHSQGGLHVQWLLERRISGSTLAARLVAAYPIGYGIDGELFAAAAPDIAVCAAPEAIRCLATWNSVGPAARADGNVANAICVNPLSWRTDGQRVDFAANPGAWGSLRLEPAVADAQCVDGRLIVTEVRTDIFDDLPMYMGQDNYHILDYSLFWLSVRNNASARLAAWQQANALAVPTES